MYLKVPQNFENIVRNHIFIFNEIVPFFFVMIKLLTRYLITLVNLFYSSYIHLAGIPGDFNFLGELPIILRSESTYSNSK